MVDMVVVLLLCWPTMVVVDGCCWPSFGCAGLHSQSLAVTVVGHKYNINNIVSSKKGNVSRLEPCCAASVAVDDKRGPFCRLLRWCWWVARSGCHCCCVAQWW